MLIDGVFSGGGLKGFALVGAFQVIEERNFQFKRVAGTSAGAIMAAFVAAGYNGKEIEEILDELDLTSLLDPRRTLLPLPFMKWMNVYRHLGLYRGKALEKWFYKKLAAKGIYTFSDLPKGSLKIIASDLTNGKIIILPDDLKNYGINAGEFSVARALRMSCGIPFFFEPVTLTTIKGNPIIVDGGVLSNFPLWIFDDENGKRIRPLLGIKLSSRREDQCARKIDNGLNLFEALFSTMKDAHDQRYISRKHEKDIIFIPVEDYSATQFELDERMKEDLINRGRSRALQFLKTWPRVRI
ncbi:patatin-like phospholipase family protein [Solibacillus sp. CAU 1738]|uniref:patatin-like phospholipase family protein n=1 Tax=Solibacillus sp. CAU 1738 TaxID=3140363 RepID=UPI003260C537